MRSRRLWEIALVLVALACLADRRLEHTRSLVLAHRHQHPGGPFWTALTTETRVDLLSLDPYRDHGDNSGRYPGVAPRPTPEPTPQRATFFGYAILGETTLSEEERERLVRALDNGIADYNVDGDPLCFEPRHGLRFASYQALICFHCGQVFVSCPDSPTVKLYTTHAPAPIFNDVLVRHHVPLPTL